MDIDSFAYLLTPCSKISTFCSDSREVVPGSVFFALKGERVDGHDFLQDVAKRGAAVCVISSHWQGEIQGPQLIRVPDVLQALQSLAKQWLEKHPVPILAITGSLGKTTIKGFLKTLLEKDRRIATARKNYNSQVGLPLTILNDLQGNEELPRFSSRCGGGAKDA